MFPQPFLQLVYVQMLNDDFYATLLYLLMWHEGVFSILDTAGGGGEGEGTSACLLAFLLIKITEGSTVVH